MVSAATTQSKKVCAPPAAGGQHALEAAGMTSRPGASRPQGESANQR